MMFKFTKNTRLRMLYLFLTVMPLLIIASVVASNTSAQTSSQIPMQGITAVERTVADNASTDLGHWLYQWQNSENGNADSSDFQIVPSIKSKNQPYPLVLNSDNQSQVDTIIDRTGHNYWTIFNECELPFDPEKGHNQCDMTSELMADFFVDDVLGHENLAEQALIVGGSMATEDGLEHMTDFVNALSRKENIDKSDIAGWHFHVYPEFDLNPNEDFLPDGEGSHKEPKADAIIDEFKAEVQAIKEWVKWAKSQGYSGDEIWITEMGCKHCPLDSGIDDEYYQHEGTTKTYMLETLEYLNDQAWLDRYAWYSGSWTMDKDWIRRYSCADRLTFTSDAVEDHRDYEYLCGKDPSSNLTLMGELYQEYLVQDDNYFILDADFNGRNNNNIQNQRKNRSSFYFGDGSPEHFVTEYFTGDWDGDGRDDIGTRFNNLLVLDSSPQLDGSRIEIHTYGVADGSDNYLVGDWDGDGDDDFGVRRGSLLILDDDFNGSNNGSGRCGDGNNRQICYYGRSNGTDNYLVGDWDGDGDDDLGVRRGKEFILDPIFGDSTTKIKFEYRNPSNEYFVGDWDNDGDDDLGVRRGNQLILDADFNNANNHGSTGCGDQFNRQICYYERGNSEKEYLVGDWDGDGDDDFGVRRAP